MKLIFLIIYLFSNELKASDCEQEKLISRYQPQYAKHFEIAYYKGFKIISSKNDRYLLTSQRLNCTTALPVFTDQVKRFIATSTTHLPFLNEFHLEKTLVGFQGVRYIYDPILRKQPIKDIQYQLSPEELLSLKPDLVMAYTTNLVSENRLHELRKMKIPVVLNFDFEEKHPLARAEWIVLSASFFSKDEEAKKLFQSVVRNYLRLKEIVKKYPKKAVLVGDIQNGRWSTCGGKSDLATLIADAGGELVLGDQHSETQFLSLEAVYQLKKKPEVWLTQNNWQDLKEQKRDSRYRKFYGIPVYNNNARINEFGFNDFWERGLMRPDLLLSDLFSILHDNKENLVWYKQLQ
jgi:iron complex transport system substrate-binding protein